MRDDLGGAGRARGLTLYVFPWTSAMRRHGLRRDAAYLARCDGHVAVADPEARPAPLVRYLRTSMSAAVTSSRLRPSITSTKVRETAAQGLSLRAVGRVLGTPYVIVNGDAVLITTAMACALLRRGVHG